MSILSNNVIFFLIYPLLMLEKYIFCLVMGQSTAFGNTIAMIGVVLFGMGTLFSFITLPVEYDASNRAIAWLQRKNMVSQQELVGAKDALKWAARTYVVAALGSLATLLYFLLRVVASNRD